MIPAGPKTAPPSPPARAPPRPSVNVSTFSFTSSSGLSDELKCVIATIGARIEAPLHIRSRCILVDRRRASHAISRSISSNETCCQRLQRFPIESDLSASFYRTHARIRGSSRRFPPGRGRTTRSMSPSQRRRAVPEAALRRSAGLARNHRSSRDRSRRTHRPARAVALDISGTVG